MKDAPKIDTQAPDTSREAVERLASFHEGVAQSFHDHIRGAYPVSHKGHAAVAATLRALLAERDLSAAREAAAAMAMRERCADMVEREGHSLHVAIRHAPLPDPAALDRLIAERVRGAVEAALDAVHEADSSELAMHGTTKIAERIEAQIAVRDSKEGRDG